MGMLGARLRRAPNKKISTMFDEEKYINPYIGGILLGLLLVLTYFIFGRGLGASGAFDRLVAFFAGLLAPAWTKNHPYWHRYYYHGHTPLTNFLVYLSIGLIIGGFVTGKILGKTRIQVQKGPKINSKERFIWAFLGGLIMAIATRFARGCTSGQALSGGATLAAGSWLFMMGFFISGPIVAFIARKLWR